MTGTVTSSCPIQTATQIIIIVKACDLEFKKHPSSVLPTFNGHPLRMTVAVHLVKTFVVFWGNRRLIIMFTRHLAQPQHPLKVRWIQFTPSLLIFLKFMEKCTPSVWFIQSSIPNHILYILFVSPLCTTGPDYLTVFHLLSQKSNHWMQVM